MDTKKPRTRFAPSPTGPLHIGGVRTALYNYLYAKSLGGDFILRIEDTDQTRFVPGAEDYILESLKWCGILPTEGQGVGGDFGPYKQSERKGLYRKYVDQLLESGQAYYAFDTPEELDKMRQDLKAAGVPSPQYNSVTRNNMRNSISLSEDKVNELLDQDTPYVVRLKVPRNEELRFHDEIRGWVVVHTTNIDDKVLFKSDGMPTYHLANIVDDHLMEITHVIRGEEWLPSAPLHVLLYRAFGWEAPKFAHLPLILKPDGNGKLSKRDGDRLGFPVFPLQWTDPSTNEISSGYREKGYFPEAFINMLAFLGWNPGTEQELFSLEELVSEFKLERVGKAGAKFDADKTKWFNQQYLRMKSNETLAALFMPYVEEAGYKADLDYLASVCGMMKERASFITEMTGEASYFFTAPDSYDEKTTRKKWKDHSADLMRDWVTELKGLEKFDDEYIESSFKAFLEKRELGIGAVLPLFRLLVTGKGMGPSMFSIASLIGQEEVISRMEEGINALSE